MSPSSKSALVFGASGISGWSVLKEIIVYPTSETFDSVVGTTNRPLSIADARLPDDSRLKLVSGIDLTLSSEKVINLMKAGIPDIANITHAYFYAYIHKPKDGLTLPELNGKLVENAVSALNELCPRLQHFILQTGGKFYGVEHADKITLPPIPWKESHPRVQEPEIASQIFYYRQLDILQKLAEGRSWRWTEVRPDCIIGYAPTGSTAMNLALLLGVFFSLWKQIHGPGSTIPFPGPRVAYQALHTDTSAGVSARFQIFASLKGDQTNKQAYNISGPVTSWAEKWPLVAAEFGLIGVGPQDDGFDAAGWVMQNKDSWSVLQKEFNLKPGIIDGADWDFLWVPYLPFDRQFDTSRSREVGFIENFGVVTPYKDAWGLMANAGLLPPTS